MTGSQPAERPRPRSEAEIRWRQFRKAPRPIVRAVASSLAVAVLLATGYLVYDIALTRGAVLPGGDLRTAFVALYVAAVLAAGAILTYVVVPQPRGSTGRTVRTAWSAALGLFAAVPICYLVLVVAVQIVKPILVGSPG